MNTPRRIDRLHRQFERGRYLRGSRCAGRNEMVRADLIAWNSRGIARLPLCCHNFAAGLTVAA
jgi:hypothetical protein